MTITYTWKVTSMKVVDTDDLQNVVIQTYWVKTGVDEDGNEGSFSGATPLSISSVDPENFVPYDELTQSIVIEWINDSITDQTHIDSRIEEQINLKKNPVVEKPLPWAESNTITANTEFISVPTEVIPAPE
jgi:hypothetical protein